ncbi:MAG: 2TM domain-containing protein [Anaerolineae bacterium]|nr:2TM domain-containing protein [Anaerolineae bacterium]
MMAEADQYDEIRRRVEKRYKKRQELITHIASYVVANVALWFFFGRDGWVMWVTFGWGIGVVSNIIDYYNKYGPGAQNKEAEIQREIERERARMAGYEKPKNDTHMRLTDDGELEEVPEDEDHWSEKPKHQS